MPPVVLPGSIWTPGALAGYQRGRTRMQALFNHFTVGTNSHGVGLRGYFHMLFNKNGPPNTYAEMDALTWHAGNWNYLGPGWEVERLTTGGYWRAGLARAEDLSNDQVYWYQKALRWAADWGIPLDHYIGPRYPGGGVNMNVNHGDMDSQRGDGMTDLRLGEETGEWQRVAHGAEPAPPDFSFLEPEEDMHGLWGPLAGQIGGVVLIQSGAKTIKLFNNQQAGEGAYGLPQSFINWMNEHPPSRTPPALRVYPVDGDAMANARWFSVERNL